jgi:hypothetical protein
MKCPICEQEMEIQSQDENTDSEIQGAYDRTIYICAKDGTWVKVEVPQQLELGLEFQ